MKRIFCITYLVLAIVFTAMAEAVGTWTVYPCYRGITKVEPAGNDVFVLANGNLYSYNDNTSEIREYNRTTDPQLSSTGITHMAWVKATGKLVIVYADYLIDLLEGKRSVSSISALQEVSSLKERDVQDIGVNGKYVFLTTKLGTLKIDTKDDFVVKTYKPGEAIPDMPTPGSGVQTKDGPCGKLWQDIQNKCWWGANADGKLAKYTEKDGTIEDAGISAAPDGPLTNSFWRLYMHKGVFYATGGCPSAGFPQEQFDNPGIVHRYADGSWSKLPDPSSKELGYDYVASTVMAFDPNDDAHFFVGARSGLYEYRNESFIRAFSCGNSTLKGMYNTDTKDYALVTSLAYDRNHTLWVMNGWTDNVLNSYSAKDYRTVGEWKSYSHPEMGYSNLYGIDLQGTFVSPSNGLLWWVNNHSNTSALIRYNTGNDRLEMYKDFQADDGGTIGIINAYSLAEDTEGNIWIATKDGPIYLSRENIVKGNTQFTRHRVSRNDGSGLADYLLAGVAMRVVKIDPANRKWFGSLNDGVYLISADNNTEVHHFTTDNSMLPSNTIYDILVDKTTGTVWFATEAGLCSYQSDVTEANGEDSSMSDDTVWAYPNPVSPDYTGPITIVGLVPSSQITITNTAGRVMNKGVCLGGSYQWDGYDGSGHRVASDVYMVNVATPEGDKGVVTKIAIVR